jgi:RimJ/RimL family protein N-acetyltransferase
LRRRTSCAGARTFDRLSDESRYRRFFSPKQHLSDPELAYLTELDHRDREAFVAIELGTADCVGVARYTRSPLASDRAELAVVVADDWQRRGVGRCR